MNSYALKTAVEMIIGNKITVSYANEGVTAFFFLFNCGDEWKAVATDAQQKLAEAGFEVERTGRKGYTLNVTHADWKAWRTGDRRI